MHRNGDNILEQDGHCVDEHYVIMDSGAKWNRLTIQISLVCQTVNQSIGLIIVLMIFRSIA